MGYGLLLRVTHTGLAAESVHVSDIRDGIEVLGGAFGFRKAGAIYVPTPANGGVSLLVYSGDVAVSFELGGIRKFIEGGYLTAEFVAGTAYKDLLPSILDEGVLLTETPTSINFVGAGVTATTVGNDVTVTIPGGGAGGDHALLSNLLWTASGHTGTAGQVAGFDGLGVPTYYGIGTDLQAWDADLDALAALATNGILVRTGPGTAETRTILGTAGNIVVTNGDGVAGDPILDVGANVITTSSVASGDVSGNYPGPLAVNDLTITGEVQGSVLYFDGSNWVQLPPGTSGQVLTTGGGGANPAWATSGGGTTDHTLLTNLGWTASGHTGTLGSLAGFDGAGAASYLTGVSNGDIAYFDGTAWTRLAPGTAGERLQTNGAGAAPTWVAAGGGTSDHSILTNLGWTVSGHTGTAGTLAAFDGAGATAFLSGVLQGDVLYFDGTEWKRLAPGTSGEFLQTQGAGSNPLWAVPSGTSWKEPVDVKGYLGTRTVAEIDLLTPTVGQSVIAGSAGTPAAGASDLLAVGDVAEFDGTDWKKILGAVGGFPPAGTRALVDTDPVTLYSPLVDGTDEGKCVEWDGTSLAPSASASPEDGYAVLVKGEGSVNENKQYIFDGIVPTGVWVQFGGSSLAHSSLSGLGWAVSGHTGTAGSVATFDNAGAADTVTGSTQGDLFYFDGTDWVRLAPGATDGNVLTTHTAGSDPTWDDSIAVDTITESTASNGILINGIRHYGKSGTDPVGPAPADGDSYYNTVLRMQMTYDGFRAKWLSVEAETIQFGRNGNVGVGQYFRATDRRVMSATKGYYAERSGTVVSLTYTRDTNNAATFDVVANGVSVATAPTAAVAGRNITLNGDFTFGQILAVVNQAGGNVMSDVVAKFKVRWRV